VACCRLERSRSSSSAAVPLTRPFPRAPWRGLIALAAISLLLVACAPDDRDAVGSEEPGGSESSPVEFEVVPEYLDDPYQSPELGIRFRPPLGWQPLEPDQREQVADALLAEQGDARHSLSLVEIFLRAETLSFAVLSRVTLEDAPIDDIADYANAFEESLGPPNEEIRATARFSVGGVPVTQIRHALGDRIVFTLVFPSAAGEVLRIDFSIPASAYEEEGIKLESSIGTLQRIDTSSEEE
jgi:hypothetical protein